MWRGLCGVHGHTVGQKDGWSWTSWVGIGAVVRAPALLPHSLCYLFVCLLPGPSGPVALPIAAHYSSFLSLLELGALPGRCGIRARVELELFDRRRVRPELVAAPFPLRRACAPGRVGPAGTGELETLSLRWRYIEAVGRGQLCWLFKTVREPRNGAWNPGAANVRAPVNTSVPVLVYGQLVRCGRARLRPT